LEWSWEGRGGAADRAAARWVRTEGRGGAADQGSAGVVVGGGGVVLQTGATLETEMESRGCGRGRGGAADRGDAGDRDGESGDFFLYVGCGYIEWYLLKCDSRGEPNHGILKAR